MVGLPGACVARVARSRLAHGLHFVAAMMRTVGSFVVCALFASGCSAAKSAMGVLSPKPQPVTIVNNVPGGTTVVETAEPKPHAKKSLMEKVGIVTTSTVVGAGLGALAAEMLDGDATASALVGAGVGAVAGVAIADD